jgi:hypothetical protein
MIQSNANANDVATSPRPSSIDPTSLSTPLDSSSSRGGTSSMNNLSEFGSSDTRGFTPTCRTVVNTTSSLEILLEVVLE